MAKKTEQPKEETAVIMPGPGLYVTRMNGIFQVLEVRTAANGNAYAIVADQGGHISVFSHHEDLSCLEEGGSFVTLRKKHGL